MIMISFGLICLLLLVIYFSRGWSIYIINGGQVVLRIPLEGINEKLWEWIDKGYHLKV
ncbi:hypothetical protein LCGC14_1563070, partial [marine sediment metagenome]